MKSLTFSTNVTYTLSFSHNNKLFAYGGVDSLVRICDVATWRQIHLLRGHTATISGVAFSKDDNFLAVASYDQALTLWSTRTGELLQRFHAPSDFAGIAFTPDSRSIAALPSFNKLLVWNLVSGREAARIPLQHGFTGARLTFSPNGNVCAAASASGVQQRTDPWKDE